MDHPANTFGQLDKGTKIFQAIDLALDNLANWEFFFYFLPRILFHRLDRKGYTFFAPFAKILGAQYLDLDLLTLL